MKTKEDNQPLLAPSPCSAIAVATVILRKNGEFLHTLITSKEIEDEDTMRGVAIKRAMELKEGYDVASVMVEIIPVPNSIIEPT